MWLGGRANRYVRRPKISAPKADRKKALEVLLRVRRLVGRHILHFDGSVTRFPRKASAATPEHILRAGIRPLFLDQVARESKKPHPIPDWLKAVMAPGVGLVTFFLDEETARTAATCV